MEKMRLEQIISKYWKNFEIKEINEKEFEVKLFLTEKFTFKKWTNLFHMLGFHFNISKLIEWDHSFGYLNTIKFKVWSIEWDEYCD